MVRPILIKPAQRKRSRAQAAIPTPAGHIFYYRAHQGKERAYLQALKSAGYHGTPEFPRQAIRFALFDLDCNFRRPQLTKLHNRGVPVFMYPHAARPMVAWDGMHKLWPHTRCSFVIAAGHKEVMERYGYPLPIEVTGWTYCEILPFKSTTEIKRILFGPIHPAANGWISQVDKNLNRRTYERLLAYCRETGVELVVRHIKSLDTNGLWKEKGVRYVRGRPDLAITEIDQADVVVGHQTFAYLAIARGKPVLMMGENIPPRTISADGTRQVSYVKSWEKYADLMMYPLDILAGDAANVIQRACQGDPGAAAWRDRFIGKQFDPKRFVRALESYL